MSHRLFGLVTFVLAAGLLPAQSAESLQRRQVLGRFLFRSPVLSGNDTVSCASCHDPEQSFTDGREESLGVMEMGVGRNAPTLIGLREGHRFPGPRPGEDELPTRPQALTLAERCLLPIENPLEMGSSIDVVTEKLRKIEGLDLSFERAFGRSGEAITPRRIGRALAAFVATLEVPAIPASRDESVARGRALFEGKGACQRCHSGKNFSDGLMHTVFVPGSRRDRAQSDRRQRLGALSVGRAADLGFRIPESGLGRAILAGLAPPEPSPFNCDTPQAMRAGRTRSGYGGTTPGVTPLVHNLPLIDVGNTGPWFRDGSAKTLEECVQTHVTELQEVAAQSARIRRELKGDLQDELLPLAMLRAPWERVGASASARPSPRSLSENEIWDLVSYLESLSTQTTVKGSASRSETTTSTL